MTLTICIFETLFLFWGFWDHFYPLGMKDSDVGSVSVEHLEWEEEMLPLVAVGDEQGLGGAIVLNI